MHKELLELLLGRRLRERMEALSPNTEDLLPEIRYGLVAAVEARKPADGVALLAYAAQALRGRQVFTDQIQRRLRLAVQLADLSVVRRYLSQQIGRSLGQQLIEVGAALALHPREQGSAREFIRRGYGILDSIPGEKGKTRGAFSLDDVRNLAEYDLAAEGLAASLVSLARWRPPEAVLSIYAEIVELSHCSSRQVASAIRKAALDSNQKLVCRVGLLLSSGELGVNSATEIVTFVGKAIPLGGAAAELLTASVPRVVLAAIRRRVARRRIAALLGAWKPKKPRGTLRRWERGIAEVREFLQQQACRQLLLKVPFDASECLHEDGGSASPAKSSDRDDTRTLRGQLARWFPGVMAGVAAQAGQSPASVASLVVEGLDGWREALRSYDARWEENQWEFAEFAADALSAVCLLDVERRDVVDQVVEVVSKQESWTYPFVLLKMSRALVEDQRYRAISERLVSEYEAKVREFRSAANDRADYLLDACELLALYNEEDARRLLDEARAEAGNWGGHSEVRSRAILTLAGSAQTHEQLSESAIHQLVAIAQHIAAVDTDGDPRTSDYLQVVARASFSSAARLYVAVESDGNVTVGQGLTALASGLVAEGKIDPTFALPVAMLAVSDGDIGAYLQLLGDHAIALGRDAALKNILKFWTTHLCRTAHTRRDAGHHRAFIQWADRHELHLRQSVQAVRSYMVSGPKEASSEAPDYSIGTGDADSLPDWVREVCQLLETDTAAALERVLSTDEEVLRTTSLRAMSPMLHRLVESASSEQAAVLASFVADAAWQEYGLEQLGLLVRLLEAARPSRSALSAVASETRAFVTKNIKRLGELAAYDSPSVLLTYLSCDSLSPGDGLQTVIGAAEAAMADLTSHALDGIVTACSQQLRGAEAASVLQEVLSLGSIGLELNADPVETSSRDETEELVQVILDCLGDPRFSVALGASQCLCEMALEKPDRVVPLILKAANGTTHERWMSVREHCLWSLRQLATRGPQHLMPYVGSIAAHATQAAFPHARIRQLAKEIALTVGAVDPSLLTNKLRMELEQVNVPSEIRPENESEAHPDRADGGSYKGRYDFDPMDTKPYWFSPLAHCFGFHRCHIVERAERWVVDEWSQTNAAVRRADRELAKRFAWEKMSHRQGTMPPVLAWSRYYDWHALQVVAGELVQQVPAAREWSGAGLSWDSWLQRSSHLLDPSLLSSLVEGPPPDTAAVASIHAQAYESWIEVACRDLLVHELVDDAARPEWVVVAGQHRRRMGDRTLDVYVNCVMVPSETAGALSRAVSTHVPSRDIYFPRLRGASEWELETLDEFLATADTELLGDQPETLDAFTMRPFAVEWYTEEELAYSDPLWPGSGRTLLTPRADFVSELGLRRLPRSVNYVDSTGRAAARCRVWDDGYALREREPEASWAGYRLQLRWDSLRQYLASRGMSLVVSISVGQARPYGGRWKTGPDETRKRESVGAMLLNADGVDLRC